MMLSAHCLLTAATVGLVLLCGTGEGEWGDVEDVLWIDFSYLVC